MVRPKPNIAPYKGIHILCSPEIHHEYYSLDNGDMSVCFPLYIDRKFFHILYDVVGNIWTSTVLDACHVINGTAVQIVHKFIESPAEILLLLVTEDPDIELLKHIVKLTLKHHGAHVPVFVQSTETFIFARKDAHRQHLDSKYGCYCIEMSFAKNAHESIKDNELLATRSMRILYTNPQEVTLRNIIIEQGFCI